MQYRPGKSVPGQQEDIRYVASVPAKHRIAPESAPQRTAYLEKPAVAGQKTVFSVTWELTQYAQYHAIDPARVVRFAMTPELAPFVAERAPHIVFTDAMREFSRKVVGDETNPYRIAQKLFAAVDRIPWAGAREYSTISNISDYALHAGHADCGQQTLLLMTLLRLNGIPTRWQSGMVFSDDGSHYNNIHDWGFVYLAPYGWVPMDVTTGRLHPSANDAPALEWFYLGGLDEYRVAFNSDFGRPFQPAKQQFRSDDVDSQRGEAEWKGGNIYFDQLDYDFDWQVLPAAHGRSGN
jgi:transglutaminase-like putative cysteine protease